MTLAVAVEFGTLPARPLLMALELGPLKGMTVTWTTVPNGILLALSFTGTGFVVPAGKVGSGIP